MPRLDDEERYGDEEYANDEIDVEEGGDEEVLEDEESLDEEHATRGRRGNRADRGAAFKGLMEESGLTESDRRQIRKNQRELLKDIEEHDALGVDEARERNNELYKSVCYTREAVLDGENLIVIANKAKKETDRMIQVRLFVGNGIVRLAERSPSGMNDRDDLIISLRIFVSHDTFRSLDTMLINLR